MSIITARENFRNSISKLNNRSNQPVRFPCGKASLIIFAFSPLNSSSHFLDSLSNFVVQERKNAEKESTKCKGDYFLKG